MRRVLLGLAAAAVALAGVIALLLIFSSRDQSGVKEQGGQAPGRAVKLQGSAHTAPPVGFRYASDPPTSGPHRVARIPGDGRRLTKDQILSALEVGDVVLLQPRGGIDPNLRKIQRTVAGERTTARTAAGGGAVVIGSYPGVGNPVVALAWGRILRSDAAPELRRFADYWLDQGAPGG